MGRSPYCTAVTMEYHHPLFLAILLSVARNFAKARPLATAPIVISWLQGFQNGMADPCTTPGS